MHRMISTLLVYVSATTLFAQPLPPTEKEQIQLLGTMIKSQVTKFRDAHPKAHGCVGNVKVKVLKDIPESYRVGYFATPEKEYDAVIRFSSGSGDVMASDKNGGPQGLALKILLDQEDRKLLVPVFGEKQTYGESKYYQTFDIVTISTLKEFMVEGVADYFPFLAAQGAAKKAFKDALAAGLSLAEAKAKADASLDAIYLAPQGGKQRPREALLIKKADAARVSNLLAETYGSWVPSQFGKDVVKYQIKPCDDVATPGDIDRSQPDFLSNQLSESLRADAHCFKLAVQRHVTGMPSVENAVGAWSEELSPYVDIASITIDQKEKGDEFIDKEVCETASFNPGHASKDHYPVGGVQRARVGGVDYMGVYTLIHQLRNENRIKN